MTELLLKLKKDGKTVGYLQLVGTKTQETASQPPMPATDGLVWYPPDMSSMALRDTELEWDTAHPFVCRDKNGKDVFEEDRVKCLYDNIDLQEAIVGLWNLTWALIDPVEVSSKERRYYQLTGYDEREGNSFDIELIEDADAP